MKKCKCRGCALGFNQKKQNNIFKIATLVILGILAFGLLGGYERKVELLPDFEMTTGEYD